MEIPGIIQNLGTYVSSKGATPLPNHQHYAPQHPKQFEDWANMYDKRSNILGSNPGGSNQFEDDIPPNATDAHGVVGNEDDPNHEQLKEMSMLPTSSRIEEIITSLKTFNIRNSMPPKLVFSETADDLALEQNVKDLFSDALCDRLRLIESLKIVLLTEDSLMSESQKIAIRKLKQKRLDANQKEEIKKFYPCLIALMKVLLIRCEEKIQRSTSADASVEHILLVMWRNVMSKLGEIFAVIIHGKDEGLIDLGTFPTDWHEIISENYKMIHSVERSGRKLNDERLKLNQEINKRNTEIAKINEQYAAIDSELKLCESSYAGNQHLLDSLTQVGQMVKKNRKAIEEIQK